MMALAGVELETLVSEPVEQSPLIQLRSGSSQCSVVCGQLSELRYKA